jgi:Ca2+-dependent lipid-binding protein
MQLNLRVVEARGLANLDLIGKSDPYVIVEMRGLPLPEGRTKVIQNSLNPVWNEIFSFPVYHTFAQRLWLKLWDEDVTTSEDLGCTNVDLRELPPGAVVDKWYPIRPAKDAKVGGDIHLILHLAPPSVSPFVQAPVPPLGEKPHVLNARIISAQDLLGASSPYVAVGIGQQRQFTETKKDTRVPQWHQDLKVFVADPADTIVDIEIYDERDSGNCLVGSIQLQTALLWYGVVYDTTLVLMAGKDMPKGVKGGGKLVVQLQLQSDRKPPVTQ